MAETLIRFEHEGALAETVGHEHGLSDAAWRELGREASDIVAHLNDRRDETPYRALPTDEARNQHPAIAKSAAAKKGRFDDLVILGIGGSALGLTALATALRPPFWNHLPAHRRDGHPRLWVMDNVDPAQFAALVNIVVDPKKTLFNVISKSGSTAETMAQFLVVLELLKSCVGDAWRDHLVVTTDAKAGLLRPLADAEGLESFVVPDGVGGRFSVLSPVGLLGAALVGIDTGGLLAGAAAMDEACTSTDFDANPAARGAAVQIGLYRKGKPMSVMMPYAAALRDVADWYRQLWAESLGKRRPDGTHVGPTPVKALGVTDQHSQVQLYREGPNDKVLTILSVEDHDTGVVMPDAVPEGMEKLGYLAGKTMAELMRAEEQATVWALARVSKRPTVKTALPSVTAEAVGALLMMLEVQTSVAGEMLGINTYDQPAVEAGKEGTRALMGMTGDLDPAKSGLPEDLATYETLRDAIRGG